MKNILIMGPQGCGKDTQAKKIAKEYNLVHISTGDILRKHIADKTTLGIAYENNYRAGRLASNDVMYEIVINALTPEIQEQGFILNGFPRNVSQLFWLYEQIHIDGCIFLDLSIDACIERLKKRGRVDDNEDAIRQRLRDYNRKTKVLMKDIGLVHTIDASQTRAKIFKTIKEKIGHGS